MITYIPYDNEKINFYNEVAGLYSYICQLDEIHLLSEKRYDALFEVGKDSSTEFHDIFYNKYREGWPRLESLYEKFIKEVVSSQFDEDFLYQKFPTYRVHLVGNVAVGAFHNDSEFGHPEGEVNFIIPLTDSNDTASVWVESEEGKKDFKPVKLQEGWLVRFNGNKLTHGNFTNDTGKSRVSMDFRILPLSKYNPESVGESITRKTKFIEGQYYKRFIK